MVVAMMMVVLMGERWWRERRGEEKGREWKAFSLSFSLSLPNF